MEWTKGRIALASVFFIAAMIAVGYYIGTLFDKSQVTVVEEELPSGASGISSTGMFGGSTSGAVG
jgi:uncharacterized membrane protein AbrB (regulator of aidB expression)